VFWFRTPLAIGASADRQQVFEGAKKEGRLVLYTGMDIEEADQYTKEFTKKHPFIKTEVFRSSGEKVQARFLVEHRANVHNADIFQTSIVQVYQLKTPAYWQSISPRRALLTRKASGPTGPLDGFLFDSLRDWLQHRWSRPKTRQTVTKIS
jgi:hypothetical protein